MFVRCFLFAQEADKFLYKPDTAAPVYNNSIKSIIQGNNTSVRSTHKIIKPVTIAAGYVGACFLSYRFLDDEVQEIAVANQIKLFIIH